MSAAVAVYFYYSPQLPDSRDLHQIELQVPLRIYSADEQLIAEYGAKRRRPVRFDEIPERLRQAFIAIEDARYYTHQGIDLKGIARSVYSVISTGRASQGASTITMQLARNAFLGNEKTLERKFKETLLAFKLERTLRKDEILELYLNKIFLGNRAYGIAAAAETYYGKDKLADLTLAQMAMLAGLPKAPSRYNPIVNPQRAMIRRDYILKRMRELGYVSADDYETAVQEPNTARVHKPDIETEAPYLAEMVRALLVEQHQDKAYTLGYHVYTTLDPDIQQQAARALRTALLDYDQRHGYRGAEDHINLDEYKESEERLDKLAAYPAIAGLQAALVIQSSAKQAELLLLDDKMEGQTVTLGLEAVNWARRFVNADRRGPKPRKVTDVLQAGDIVRVTQVTPAADKPEDKQEAAATPVWQLSQLPDVSGALVVMQPDNGAIRAVMGGFDFQYSKFNRVTQAMRQPGSSFKPFIYSAAMTRGFTPTSIINDAPITVPGSDWQPKNFGGKYIGPTTLAEALAKSRNLVSIRLLRTTGIPYTIDYAKRFGFEEKYLPPNLTLALGTGLTTPLQMATAYSSFANGGFKVNAHFIKRIEDSNGQVLYEAGKDIRQACGDYPEYCPVPAADQAEDAKTDTKSTATDTEPETPESATSETENPATPPAQLLAAPRIMDAATNRQIVSMLHGVTQFGTAARTGRTLKRKDIAGKTGTTNDQKDSWFCGFTPDYVAVAWAGFDDMAELGEGETSTKIAVPMWLDLMSGVLKDHPESPWKYDDGKLYRAALDAAVSATDDSAMSDEETRQANLADMPMQDSTPRFEYISAQAAAQAAYQQQYPQQQQQRQEELFLEANVLAPVAAPPPPAPTAEAVEIPEQIF
ncbi:MAG: penicillin-binding protein 1A [Thiolinea sp.]